MKRLRLALFALLIFPSFAFGQARFDQPFLKTLPAGGVAGYSGLAQVCLGTGLTTTAASITGNVATLTMSSNPVTAGFINGRDVLLINFTGGDAFLNSTFTLTNVSSTQLQFSITHGNWTTSSNGGAVMKPSTAAGTACAPVTPVYSDQGLTTQLNSGTTFADDGSGNIRFFAAAGTYWLSYSASGAAPYLQQITVPVAANASGSVPLVSPTITGTDSGAEILQNKTIDISANTLKSSSNTAGHYPRNNGTTGYVDNTIQAADLPATTSNCAAGAGFAQGLNAGGTPICGSRTIAIEYVIDNAGTALTTGVKGDLVIPFACTLSGVTLLADQSGSVVVDIWKQVYASYPPTVAQTITASAIPTITTATKAQDLTLTGWTKTINAGDTLRFNVNSATTITRVTVALQATIP